MPRNRNEFIFNNDWAVNYNRLGAQVVLDAQQIEAEVMANLINKKIPAKKETSEKATTIEQDFKRCPYVFVYGTLMSGMPNNSLLGKSKLVADAVTAVSAILKTNGYLPFLTRVGSKADYYIHNRIYGEIWSMSDVGILKAIDTLEGHPDLYTREKIVTNVTDAWTYVYKHEVPKHWPAIKNGSFRDFHKDLIDKYTKEVKAEKGIEPVAIIAANA